ncbi:MAG: HEAT repeat domain-containing protein [Deltaproteobacteria bacterium]|nr:HEAT repeat domain-containing protein [Deltaproteobacteria bacterium]
MRLGSALLLALLLAACSKGDKTAKGDDAAPARASQPSRQTSEQVEQVLISDLTIRETDNPLGYQLYREQLAQRLGRQLTGSGLFFALPNQTDPMRPARRAKIELVVSYERIPAGSTGKPSLLAAVEGRVTWEGDDEPFLRENLVGERVLEGEKPEDLPKIGAAHVATTVEEIGRGLIAQEKLRGGPLTSLVATLEGGHSDPNLLRFALMQVGERPLEGAVGLAARHLGSKHPAVRSEAIAALVRLKDPAAVDPLTKSVEFDDYDSVRAVVEAAAAIGGEDAEAYLDFVASGHPDDGIKKRAKEALERLQRKRTEE